MITPSAIMINGLSALILSIAFWTYLSVISPRSSNGLATVWIASSQGSTWSNTCTVSSTKTSFSPIWNFVLTLSDFSSSVSGLSAAANSLFRASSSLISAYFRTTSNNVETSSLRGTIPTNSPMTLSLNFILDISSRNGFTTNCVFAVSSLTIVNTMSNFVSS